jgi:hypothetical protein
MPKFITAFAVAGIVTIAAASATTANAQMWFPAPSAAPIHDPGDVDRIGDLCWVNTETYKEIDVHGYWRACEPATFGVHPVVHHRGNRMSR